MSYITPELKAELIAKLDGPVKDTWGTFNKICPTCLSRFGHNLQWCNGCGGKCVDFEKLGYVPTLRQYFKAEMNKHRRYDKMGTWYHYIVCSEKISIVTDKWPMNYVDYKEDQERHGTNGAVCYDEAFVEVFDIINKELWN